MPESPKQFIQEAKRRFHRTEELFARSLSLWDELEHIVQSTSYTLDELLDMAKKQKGIDGLFFSAHLEVMKLHLNSAKKRKHLERPREAHFNKIPPSRLIKRV